MKNAHARYLLHELLTEDFSCFVRWCFQELCPGQDYYHGWHLDALHWRLAQAGKGHIRRLIVNQPPRSLKSVSASVALPAWLHGLDPKRRIVCVSYSDELARKNARDYRSIVQSAWYRREFPQMRISKSKNTETEVVTTQHGFRLATSISGTLTGRGGDIIIIDDPIKPAEAMSDAERRRVNEWYDTTLLSRLDDPRTGVILLVMQRLHEDDLTGHLLRKGGFEHLRLPAIADQDLEIPVGPDSVHLFRVGEALHPERADLVELEKTRKAMGSLVFSAQFLQAPIPIEGNLVQRAWLRHYAQPRSRDSFIKIVQSWDAASKTSSEADWSVCTTWGTTQNEAWLLDRIRGRWEYPELLRQCRAQADIHRPHAILIEDSSNGAALIQTLFQETALPVIAVKPKLDKETRVTQISHLFESGRVHFPESASWLAEFEEELLGFPNARYNDQVDSVVQFLLWFADQSRRPRVSLHPPIIIRA